MRQSEREALRVLAQKATSGEWYADEMDSVCRKPSGRMIADCCIVATEDCPTATECSNNAKFIAACSPERILSLLDLLAEEAAL